jgi:Flp pilus assembly protein TadD
MADSTNTPSTTSDETLQQGHAHHQAGRLAEARDAYKETLARHPDHPQALHLLGMIALQIGDLDNAGDLLRRAIAVNPAVAAYHEHLGAVYQSQGNMAEAAKSFHQVTTLTPGSANAYTNLAVLLHRMGRTRDAVDACRRAQAITPEDAKVHTNLAGMLYSCGDMAAAAVAGRRAVELDPTAVDAHRNLGQILRSQGEFDDAITAHRRAIELAPETGDLHYNLGIALDSSGDPTSAIAAFEAAVSLKPDYPEALNNLAISQISVGRLDLALEACRRCLEANPDHSRAHGTLAMILLGLGDYEGGFREYEWRWQIPSWPEAPRDIPQPALTDMTIPAQTILVHAEQGYGDTIQFIRFASWLGLEYPGRVILECPTLFLRLFADIPGIDHMVERATALPAFDVHAPLLSLPWLFGVTVGTVSTGEPYLAADPALVASWCGRMGDDDAALKVGLVWGSNVENMVGAQKSIPLEQLRSLLAVPGTRFFSLQVDDSAQEIAALGLTDTMIDLGTSFEDFADTAAVLPTLDLLISVDTAAAHLAGAIGTPVWTLLKFAPDWRWMLEREDSPWYPTMRLFRQHRLDDWVPVIEQVAIDLAALAGGDETKLLPSLWKTPPATRVTMS